MEKGLLQNGTVVILSEAKDLPNKVVFCQKQEILRLAASE